MNTVGRAAAQVVIAILVVGAGCTSVWAQDQPEWWLRSNVFRTKYYIVKTDLPRDQALKLGRHMDMTFDAYAATFAGLPLRRPARLHMYLFATQQDYRQTLETRFRVKVTGTWGGCVTHRNLISIVAWKGHYNVAAVETLLQHEAFHQFSTHLFPNLPRWADEGLAGVFARGVRINNRIVLGQVTQDDKRQLAAAIEANRFLPLARIFAIQRKDWNEHLHRGDAQVNYLQAWCIVHFFLYADDGKYHPPFIKFLAGLNQGLDGKRAFEAAFSTSDFAAIESAWLKHTKQLPPMDYKETIRRLEFFAAGMNELRKRKMRPISFGELKQGLREIDFKRTSSLFGESRELSASNEQLFEVPYARFTATNPTFELVDSQGLKPNKEAGGNVSRQARSRRSPRPLNIVTKGLGPRNFAVHWKRVPRKSGYTPLFVADEPPRREHPLRRVND